MTPRFLFSHLLTLLLASSLWAGEFDRPKTLANQGEIPAFFLELAQDKYANQAIQSSIYRPRGERLAELEFFKKNHFGINSLVLSGNVLFGTKLNDYVNRVADEILADQPKLRQELQFYVLNSPYVNAFATDFGVIFVNIGLLAKVETEAQLAFVLCHEITHYVKQHNFSNHIEEYKRENNMDDYRNTEPHDKLVRKHSYTQELESEADAGGLFLFLNSKYNSQDIEQVFDVLQFADLPHENQAIDWSWLTAPGQQPDSSWVHIALDEFVPESEDDRYSTHPSVHKRKAWVLENIGPEDGGSADFLVSEADFKAVQRLAREQLPRLHLAENNFARAYYHAWLLRDQYPGFAKITASKALLRLASLKKQNDSKTYRYRDHALYQLQNALADLENDALFAYGWRLAEQAYAAYPDDPEALALMAFYAKTYKDNVFDRESVTVTFEDSWDTERIEAAMKVRAPQKLVKGGTTLVLNPNLIFLNYRKNYPYQLFRSESSSLAMSSAYQEEVKNMGIHMEVMQPHWFDPTESIRLYELGILRNYMLDMIDNDAEQQFPNDFMEIQTIMKKYMVDDLVWTFGVSMSDSKKVNIFAVYAAIITSAIFPPVAPLWIYSFLNPQRYSVIVSFRANLNSHEMNLLDYQSKRRGIGKGRIKKVATKTIRKAFLY